MQISRHRALDIKPNRMTNYTQLARRTQLRRPGQHKLNLTVTLLVSLAPFHVHPHPCPIGTPCAATPSLQF
ncbi:hypothetical protein E2C01_069532 [Portunus trituberculatus]|uniref:Uncharacterized protein n=1 Tax=Portunus trituberculatus TaxID=210409 RepID=A0A5B7I2L0_PORTR|nr:hypothetical protein [Portunus trituberculatus]